MSATIPTLIEDFFTKLGITLESCTVVLHDDDVDIEIKTPDSALLIGMHGKNIESLGHLLGRMVEKQLGHYAHVHLEVNDYMKAKDERLFRFLDSKIAYIQSTGTKLKMANLSAFERKKAHNYIAEKNIPGLSTQSEWAWEERAMFIIYTGELRAAPAQMNHTTHAPVNTPTHTLDELSEDGIGI